jgi:hypothetical protein
VSLTDPVATALIAAEALERRGHRYALMGGLLMAAYGEPRETHDADIAVLELTPSLVKEALEASGMPCAITKSSQPAAIVGGFWISRVALLGDEVLRVNVLDLVRPRSDRYAEAALARSVSAPLRDREVPALSPEDFVVFKALSTRDRDYDDAASVLRRSGDRLDVALIEAEVGRLAAEVPEWDARRCWAIIRERGTRSSDAFS